jgi:O-antigen/teichoic acid export membrane protein
VSSDSLRSRVVSGFFWLAATKISGQAISWVITLVVVRLLTPLDYGLIGMAVLVNSFLLLFNELGLGAAIIQKRDLSRSHLSDLRWVILLVNVGLFGVVLLVAPAVGHYFDEPGLVNIVRTMGIVFVINGLGAPSGFMLIREMRFRQKAQSELIANTAAGATTLGFALAGFGAWSLVAGYVVLHTTLGTLYCFHYPIPIQPPSFGAGVVASLRFGSQVALSKVFWWISASADTVVVGKLLGTAQLGYYGLAVQFASLPLEKIVSLITQVALPSFAALQNDPATLRRYYLKLVGLIAFITFPVFLGLLLVADGGVTLVLTEKWAPIVLPLQVLCLASALRAIETMNTPLLIASGHPRIPLLNGLLQAIVLPLAFLVGSRWGITGVAVGWLVAWPILYLIVTAQTLRVLELPAAAYLRTLRHAINASIVMAVAVIAVRQVTPGATSLPGLILQCLVGALSYVAYHAAFNRTTLWDVLETRKLRKTPTTRARAPETTTPPTGADHRLTINESA